MGRVQMEEIVMRRRIRAVRRREEGRKGLFQHYNQSKSNQISPGLDWIGLDLFA
jgi:hypothetical protein